MYGYVNDSLVSADVVIKNPLEVAVAEEGENDVVDFVEIEIRVIVAVAKISGNRIVVDVVEIAAVIIERARNVVQVLNTNGEDDFHVEADWLAAVLGVVEDESSIFAEIVTGSVPGTGIPPPSACAERRVVPSAYFTREIAGEDVEKIARARPGVVIAAPVVSPPSREIPVIPPAALEVVVVVPPA